MYYAVKEGKNTGIFDNYDDYRASVVGYPNAEYERFDSFKDAISYYYGFDIVNLYKEQAERINGVIAFIGGSYGNGKYSFADIIIDKTGVINTMSAYDSNSDYLPSRNVAGELFGVMYAVKYANDNNYKNMIICINFEGPIKIRNGQWNKTKKKAIDDYIEFINKYKESISIIFEKIRPNRNDKYSDMVNKLANDILEGEGTVIDTLKIL